jgi:hypothetical protein
MSGREVRKVPASWIHPRYTADDAPFQQAIGRYIPLDVGYNGNACRWIDEAERDLQSALDNYGNPPDKNKYMPEWRDEECTHFMMYETTSEGTPLSPPIDTPEHLAEFLVTTGACVFADLTATYDQWLKIINGGNVSITLWPRGGHAYEVL